MQEGKPGAAIGVAIKFDARHDEVPIAKSRINALTTGGMVRIIAAKMQNQNPIRLSAITWPTCLPMENKP